MTNATPKPGDVIEIDASTGRHTWTMRVVCVDSTEFSCVECGDDSDVEHVFSIRTPFRHVECVDAERELVLTDPVNSWTLTTTPNREMAGLRFDHVLRNTRGVIMHRGTYFAETHRDIVQESLAKGWTERTTDDARRDNDDGVSFEPGTDYDDDPSWDGDAPAEDNRPYHVLLVQFGRGETYGVEFGDYEYGCVTAELDGMDDDDTTGTKILTVSDAAQSTIDAAVLAFNTQKGLV